MDEGISLCVQNTFGCSINVEENLKVRGVRSANTGHIERSFDLCIRARLMITSRERLIKEVSFNVFFNLLYKLTKVSREKAAMYVEDLALSVALRAGQVEIKTLFNTGQISCTC